MASFQEAELRGLGHFCRICRRFGDDDDTEDPMAVLESACDCEGQARVGCVLARAQKSGLWTRCGTCKATFKASALATRCALAVGRAEALDGRAADRGAFDLDESVDCRGDDDVKRALAAAVAARDKADLGRAEDVISRVRRTGAKGAADAFCPACAARPGTHESGCVCVARARRCAPLRRRLRPRRRLPACGEPLFGGATTQEAYLDALRGGSTPRGPGSTRGQTNALNLAAAHVEGQRDGAEAEHSRATALGLGCDRDARRAAALYEDAARLGHGEAASDLGVCYETGDGVEPDAARRGVVRGGARLGSAAARFNLGCFKLRTAFKPTDVAEAADLFRQAADAGHVTALRNLAVLYEEGQGVDKDVAEAARLERRADALEEGGVEEEKDDPPTPAPPASLPPGGPRRPRGGRA
ncbi:hypothetical protein JL720_8458 [Aureococcus anophagefferens]|nr:hypothetical protein JL720_8458 [Aureococcus anophagefferens]